MNDNINTLSAISTIITVIAILYSLWYSEIDKMTNLSMSRFESDRSQKRKEIDQVLKSKSIPLIIINAIFFIIFLPESIKLIIISFKNVISGFSCSFDSIIASIIFINILSFLLLYLSISMAIKMYKLREEKGL